MSSIVQAARTAREKLASALALLQSPNAGELIDSVAPPVAAAMGSLHAVETSQGEKARESIPQALTHVQAALAALQLAPPAHPVVDQATADVAQALGLIHGLARNPAVTGEHRERPAPAPRAEPEAARVPDIAKTQITGMAPVASAEASVGQPAAVAGQGNVASTAEPSAAPEARAAQVEAAAQRSTAGLDRTALSRDAPDFSESEKAEERERRRAALAATAQVTSTPLETARGTAPVNSAARTPSGSGPGTTADFNDSRHAAPPAEGRPAGSVTVEANLGAHSPTNFFKGLSGNDVVDDGGLFIATYDIPKPGTPLWLKVTLPGGYEFEAAGAVRWTREAGAGDAPPGFGAIFIRLSPEARQLVYRYVRNREPIFYDDM